MSDEKEQAKVPEENLKKEDSSKQQHPRPPEDFDPPDNTGNTVPSDI